MKDFATVAELLADESRWCRHELAKNAEGHPTNFRGEEAVSFCLIGAIHRVNGVEYQAQLAADRLAKVIGTITIEMWNDTHTHAEVLAAVKAAGI